MEKIMPLIHILREMRAQIHAGSITLDEAAAKLGADPDIGLTEVGARDLLSRPSVDVEGEYRRIFEATEIAHRYWTS